MEELQKTTIGSIPKTHHELSSHYGWLTKLITLAARVEKLPFKAQSANKSWGMPVLKPELLILGGLSFAYVQILPWYSKRTLSQLTVLCCFLSTLSSNPHLNKDVLLLMTNIACTHLVICLLLFITIIFLSTHFSVSLGYELPCKVSSFFIILLVVLS